MSVGPVDCTSMCATGSPEAPVTCTISAESAGGRRCRSPPPVCSGHRRPGHFGARGDVVGARRGRGAARGGGGVGDVAGVRGERVVGTARGDFAQQNFVGVAQFGELQHRLAAQFVLVLLSQRVGLGARAVERGGVVGVVQDGQCRHHHQHNHHRADQHLHQGVARLAGQPVRHRPTVGSAWLGPSCPLALATGGKRLCGSSQCRALVSASPLDSGHRDL